MSNAELTMDDIFEAGYAIYMVDIGRVVQFRTKTQKFIFRINQFTIPWFLKYTEEFPVAGRQLPIRCVKVKDLEQLRKVNHGAI